MKPWQILAVGVLLGLIAGGIISLIVSPPRGYPVQLSPLPTPAAPLVYVSGEVIHPGVYEIPAGSRVEEAIQKAGGFTDSAVDEAVNLASVVTDGLHIHIPAQGEWVAENPPPGEKSQLPSLLLPVDINSASQSELELLPGIGPTRAQSIVEYRHNQGVFTAVEQIQQVPGIGETIYQQIKELITVGNALPPQGE